MRVSRRRLGRDGPQLPVLSLGSWQTWDRIGFEDAVELVAHAAGAGIDLFDVGHYNVGPHSEGSHTDVLFGRIASAAGLARDDYRLCQKLWLWRYPEQSLADQLERCLFRVGTDRVELVVLGDFVGELDIGAVVDEMGALVRDGRVGHWGVNNWAAADLEAAHELAARAFCLTHPATVNVLFGASRLDQLEQNIAAVELAERHGDAVRARLEEFWLDRDAVAPDASWGATRAAAIAAGRP